MRTARYIVTGAVLVVVGFVALAVGEPSDTIQEVATVPAAVEAAPAATPTPAASPTPAEAADGAADVGGAGLQVANTDLAAETDDIENNSAAEVS
ncbi:MAG: hypothetical protein AAF480_11195, partial [Actinomycetota bacterium]